MTEPTRWVIIDDNDSRIKYAGTWTSTNGNAYRTQGNFGLVYQNTLHGSNTDASSFSFTFTGNGARIMGTNDLNIDANGVADPDWDCLLGGQVVAKQSYFQYVENNWVFCSFQDLTAGQYTIGLKVKTKGRTFWFDQIQYRPTGVVQNEVVATTRDDADLSYSKGWAALANVGYNTLVGGSTATFRFIGSGVSLWAMYPHELPHGPGTSTYTIDGGPIVTFTIPGGGDTSIYNRKIFEVSGLANQAHTLQLAYQSTSGGTPLVVGQFLISGGTNLRASAVGSDNSASSTTSSLITTSQPATTTARGDIIPGTDAATSLVVTPASSATVYLPGASSTSAGGGSGSKVAGGADAADPSDSGSSTGSAVQTGNSGVGGSSTGHSSIGIIIGAILGALAVIILLLWFIWYRRRRRIHLQSDPGDLNPYTGPPAVAPSLVQSPTRQTLLPNRGGTGLYPAAYSSPGVFDSPAPAPPHPAAQNKGGPIFNSPFISKYNPYQPTTVTTTSNSSSTHLIPQSTGEVFRGHHHQATGSASYSVGASSHYTDSNSSSTGPRPVFHQDSGVRIPAHPPSETVEYPPIYTAS